MSATAAEILDEWGWVKTKSKVREPDGAWRYWQRWENGEPMGWVELPHDMPIDMVMKTIRSVEQAALTTTR